MSSSLTRHFSTSDRFAVLFAALYTTIAGFLAVRHGNAEFVIYVGVLVVLALVIAWVHVRVGLHPLTIWALAVWGLMHMLGGLLDIGDGRVLYNWRPFESLPRYDQAVHAYGFGIATWTVWQGLSSALGAARPTFGLLTISGLAGMGLGALNEVVEFAAVLLVPDTNVGGYENTAWDLVSNLVGACLAAVAIGVASALWSGRRRDRSAADREVDALGRGDVADHGARAGRRR